MSKKTHADFEEYRGQTERREGKSPDSRGSGEGAPRKGERVARTPLFYLSPNGLATLADMGDACAVVPAKKSLKLSGWGNLRSGLLISHFSKFTA